MTFTSMFEPVVLISLCLILGVLIGCLTTLYAMSKEHKALQEELDAKTETLNRYARMFDWEFEGLDDDE